MAVCRLYPRATAKYAFRCRSERLFPDGFAERLREIVSLFKYRYLQDHEYEFLKKTCYYMDPVYLGFLKGYRYNPDEVTIKQDGSKISVVIEGLWHSVILWEVPLMAAISELFFEMTDERNRNEIHKAVEEKTRFKAEGLNKIGVQYSEFGTRRRYSYSVQCTVLENLMKHDNLVGTSNVHLAQKYGLLPVGTVAHEFIMGHAAMFGYTVANRMSMEAWTSVFGGQLGIGLTDTFTTDAFFKDFDVKYAKLYDGIRQDSGDPLAFIDKAVAHYKKCRIDPASKVLLFSDGLNKLEQIADIHRKCQGQAIDRYGIVTWLTNDIGIPALNMVIKMVECNGRPTVKLSDVPTKNTGSPEDIELCKKTLGVI